MAHDDEAAARFGSPQPEAPRHDPGMAAHGGATGTGGDGHPYGGDNPGDQPRVGRHRAPQNVIPPGYEAVTARLAAEFGRVHPAEIISRCVSAAQHGALDIIGSAAPDQVERIARKHLQVLAIVAAERGGSGRRPAY